MVDYRSKAIAEFSSCGTGNHYVDLMEDEAWLVWIGVHFGNRGLRHTSAIKYLKLAGGRDGMHVPPAVVDEDSEIGVRYIAAMNLASRYAYSARACVIERVRGIIGGSVVDRVHNNHNLAWKENHVVNGVAQDLWVVCKGATPAFPGQRGFVGGSMGNNAVILEGVDSEEAKASLCIRQCTARGGYSGVEALRTFTQSQMDAWLRERGSCRCGNLDNKLDGLSSATGCAGMPCKLDQDRVHAQTFRHGNGGKGNGRSLEGLIKPITPQGVRHRRPDEAPNASAEIRKRLSCAIQPFASASVANPAAVWGRAPKLTISTAKLPSSRATMR